MTRLTSRPSHLTPSRIESFARAIRLHLDEMGGSAEAAYDSLVRPAWAYDYAVACGLDAEDGPHLPDLLSTGSANYEAACARARVHVREAVLSAVRAMTAAKF